MSRRPTLILRLSDDARADIVAAHQWYAERSPISAVSFIRQVDRLLGRIQSFPELFPVFDLGLRRAPLARYPHCLFYRLVEERIEVEACLHDHRDPAYLQARSV
ncbi:MAG: type II toxin-antitoxin system RelE/ParE family toxin [Niveispirillum sp.]|uniref:type II toxin-antitoxin system RelE/ParE family toxin n=1 Tax=Niveispirillum sp. TaxID=1917217 RepID=UPI0040351CD7